MSADGNVTRIDGNVSVQVENLLKSNVLYSDLKRQLKKIFPATFDPDERANDLTKYLDGKEVAGLHGRDYSLFLPKVLDHFGQVFEAEGVQFLTVEPKEEEGKTHF